ncbi:MAG TPA: hypothetical protein VMS35_08370, partial [Nitrososphaeraceae archaeon]|nr:hypothetical protein [Nitrososphaeraceae archaeon]
KVLYIFIKNTSITNKNDNKFYQKFVKFKTVFLKIFSLFMLNILIYGELSFVLSEFLEVSMYGGVFRWLN